MSDLVSEMAYGEYEVIGVFKFLGVDPGETFVGRLDPRHEARAVSRGTLRLVRRYTPTLDEGSYRLPRGWLDE